MVSMTSVESVADGLKVRLHEIRQRAPYTLPVEVCLRCVLAVEALLPMRFPSLESPPVYAVAEGELDAAWEELLTRAHRVIDVRETRAHRTAPDVLPALHAALDALTPLWRRGRFDLARAQDREASRGGTRPSGARSRARALQAKWPELRGLFCEE